MNRINKFIISLLVFIFSSFVSYSQNDCIVTLLANDLSASTAEFKAVVNESKGFDAWQVLNKEKPSLRTNIEELNLVSKNIDEIKNAGGYLKWKELKEVGNLANKLDNTLFSTLKEKYNQLDDVLKPQFLDDFANAGDDVLKKLQDENLFEVWKSTIRSNKIEELLLFAKKGDVRLKYQEALSAFVGEEERLMKLYASDPNKFEKVAKGMFDLRLKTTTRFKHEETPEDLLEWIFKFNEKRYSPVGGNKYGHTWESIIKVNKTKGFEGDALYQKIISSSKTALGDGDKMKLGIDIMDSFKTSSLNDRVLLKQILDKYRMLPHE